MPLGGSILGFYSLQKGTRFEWFRLPADDVSVAVVNVAA